MPDLPYEVDKSLRIKQLKEDNEKEDKLIKKLEKKLGLSKRKNKNNPPWMAESNFDDILNILSEEDESDADDNKEPCFIGELPKKKKKIKNIYADENTNENLLNEITPAVNDDKEAMEISKVIRRNFNMISESQMTRVIDDIINLFGNHPKTLLKNVLFNEIIDLLKFTPFSFRDQNLGWFHQDLAICIASINVTLISTQQDQQFHYLIIERLVLMLLDPNIQKDSEYFISLNVLLVYLYRFHVVCHKLLLDLALEYAMEKSSDRSNLVRIICQAVGVFLRKDDLEKSKVLMDFLKNTIREDSDLEKLIKFDFEASIKYLEHKKVKEVWITRADNLKKMVKVWTRGYSLSQNLAMNVGLEDIKNIEAKGRWWLVGSSYIPGQTMFDENKTPVDEKHFISKEILATAKDLGFLTPFRQEIFNILATNNTGPDGTAMSLLKACGSSKNETREREMVGVIMQCLILEQPYNPFYGQVLGSILTSNHRFTIMIRCSIWDAIQKAELSVEAKRNCGRVSAFLFVRYQFPLTCIKKFNFGDMTEANIAYLKEFFNQTIKDSFSALLLSVRKFCEDLPKFSKNLRIFIKKHCIACDSDEKQDELILHRFNELVDLIQTLLVNQ